MSTALEPVRPIQLTEIKQARERISGTIIRTPLIRLELGSGYPDISIAILNYAVYFIIRQPVLFCIMTKTFPVKFINASISGSYPDIAFFVLEHGTN